MNHPQLQLTWFDAIANDAHEHNDIAVDIYLSDEEARRRAEATTRNNDDAKEIELSDWLVNVRDVFYGDDTAKKVIAKLLFDENIDASAPPTVEVDHFVAQAPQYPLRLLKHLESQYLCDVHLATQDQRVPAHSALLAAQSDYFRAMFSRWHCDDNVVHVDSDETTLRYVLHYIYTGELHPSLDENHIITCFHLSQHFMIHSLNQALLHLIYNSITSANVCDFLDLAQLYDLRVLKERCLTVAIRNLSQIDSSDVFTSLPAKLRESLYTLRQSFQYLNHVASRNCPTVEYTRELLGIMKETLRDEEDVYQDSLALYQADLANCNQRIDAASRITHRDAYVNDMAMLMAWHERLDKVGRCLEAKRKQLDRQQAFYKQQKRALDIALEADMIH